MLVLESEGLVYLATAGVSWAAAAGLPAGLQDETAAPSDCQAGLEQLQQPVLLAACLLAGLYTRPRRVTA